MATGFKTATVTSGDVPSTQTNFPAYVDLSRLGITTLAEAQSVRVYADEDKTTEWAREIVSASEMWVKVPSLTSTTSIYIDWDGVRSDYATTDTYGRNNVWTGYLVVSHGIDTDSTGNNRNFTGFGGVTLGGATGVTGAATTFDGVNDYANIAYAAWQNFGTSDVTIQIWVKTTTSSAYQPVSNFGDVDTYTTADSFGHELTASNTFGHKFRASGTGVAATGGAYTTGAWYKLTSAADRSGSLVTYVNGSSTLSTSISAQSTGSLNSGTYGIYIATTRGTSTFSPITACEYRILSGLISADWDTTEYNNQSDEPGFWGSWASVGADTSNSIFAFGGF